MKINTQNQLGLNFTEEIKSHFYRLHSEKYFNQYPEDIIAPYKKQWQNILSDNGNKNLLFTQTSLEVANKIKIDNFEPKVLKISKPNKFTYLINDNHFYRVMISQEEIFGLNVRKTLMENGQFYFTYDSFKIIPSENRVVYPVNQSNYLEDKYFSEFLKLLIFTQYSELDETIINPKQSAGTKKQGKYLNESNKPFILVDSAWNKIIVRKEGFGVVGHLRWQPTGKGRSERKLIYIREFIKNGYVREAKREKI